MFSLAARSCAPPAAGFRSGPLQNTCFTVFSALAPQKIMFSRVWGAMPPKASLVTCLGRLGHQNRPKKFPKGSLLLCLLACRFEGLVLLLLFVWFSKWSDPRSARASAVETQLFIFGVASNKVSFLQQLSGHFWYNWRRDPLKKHFEIEFENRNCKSVVVLLSDSILASFWTPYGESFRASGALVPSKRQGFREPGALDSQKVVSHPV